MADSFDLQHVNVKFFVKNADAINLEDAINVFHSWIRDQKLDDLLIDVADYRHVPSGPGVILVGHNAHYAFDNAESRLGILYNRKTVVESKGADQIQKTIEAAQGICRLIAKEDAFAGKFEIASDCLQLIINDRLLGANTQEGFERLLPEMTAALVRVFGEQDYQFERSSDPRKRLTVTVKVPTGVSI